ncbi:hypothetical protein N0V88_001948 [Collariella sp. IMI 366227]|nr:hypothetical protein N0V88_001948 [Collariella sp. IMI 366227]
MDRIRAFFAPAKASPEEYEPLTDDDSVTLEGSIHEAEASFSWIEYSIFALIGVAMLWAWNMFLAAAPYFQVRFQSSPWIVANSQSAILTTFTVINLVAMLVLTNIQSSANYSWRINAALLINAVVFGLLTLSTTYFLDASPNAYLAFILLMVALTAWAAGLMQNGAFAFAASFGRTEYTQAIMAGQGPLPLLLTPPPPAHPLLQLLSKLRWLAASVALCFIVTMSFPVFTAKILSVHPRPHLLHQPHLLPGAFIPLAFFFWNLGDLAGRLRLDRQLWIGRHPHEASGVAQRHGQLELGVVRVGAEQAAQVVVFLQLDIAMCVGASFGYPK